MSWLFIVANSLEQIKLNGLPDAGADPDKVQVILQIVFGIAGALALLFIIIGGLRYVISTGDPQETAKAKNAIIYALVGLVLALTAEALVTWVLGEIF